MITGADTNIHVAFLSRLPIVARHPHTAGEFLLDGRRLQVCRASAEIEVQIKPGLNYTLIAAHLKSRRTSMEADQAGELARRKQKILRRIYLTEQILTGDPAGARLNSCWANLNDTKKDFRFSPQGNPSIYRAAAPKKSSNSLDVRCCDIERLTIS